jgi:hypothetical protein
VTTIEELQDHNWAHFLDRGPGLSYGYETWVVARDRTKHRVLIGGLGGCGVGQSWRDEDPPYHSQKAGYKDAPERQDGT